MTEGAPGQAHFEKIFEQPDPWRYGSPYEREKYRRQLDLLPPGVVGRGLELGCAEGHFTAMLASRVGHLMAADISPTALARAKTRCAAWPDIEFLVFDLARDELPGNIDLIICSEVLYYLAGEAELRGAARALTAALAPGGVLITGNAYLLHDNNRRTGFDWETNFGAETINRVLRETAGLALEASIETELYRIDRFCRRDTLTAPPPVVTKLPVTTELDPDMARHIVWGGAVHTRREWATRRTSRVPVLAYEIVSEGGRTPHCVPPALFEAQLRWLRAQGFHSISLAELERHLRAQQPFAGRPVLITVDDGLQDTAGPVRRLLQAYDFSAESLQRAGSVTGGGIGFGGGEGPVHLGMDVRDLPGILVRGDSTIEEFIRAMRGF
jgi:SAM-dependent methyltransferase